MYKKFLAGFIILFAICFFGRRTFSYEGLINRGIYWRQDASDDKDWVIEMQSGDGNGSVTGSVLTLEFKTNQTTSDATTDYQWLDADGGTPILNIDTVNERVGVSTAAPDVVLHVQEGDASAVSHSGAVLTVEDTGSYVSIQMLSPNTSEQQLRFGDPQDDGAGILAYNHSTNKFQYAVGGPVRLTLDSSGNVGINDATPDGSFDITGTAAATVTLDIDIAAAQSANIIDIDDAAGVAVFTMDSTGDVVLRTINYGTDAEADDDYSADISGVSSYVTGLPVYFYANTANTGACTLNVSQLGAKSLKSLHDQDPADNYIEAGSIVHCVYDGTNFQILSPDANP